MRDHGGDLDRAQRRFGQGPWLDLSTGINAVPYPVPELASEAWARLPDRSSVAALEQAAAAAYKTSADVVAVSGAQAAIQLVPRLRAPGVAGVVTPTYNEHAAALRKQGWQVLELERLDAAEGFDLVIVVNPNNPDGRRWSRAALEDCVARNGLLVVDESFADPHPELSLAPFIDAQTQNIVIQRSFGKFYGLAGVRLGFALTGAQLAAALRDLAGPWAVSGPAIAIGQAALSNTGWQDETRARLASEAQRMDAMADRAGWSLVGGTDLFRTYATPNAEEAQVALAERHVWSRVFPYSERWIRLGLPGESADWARLESCLSGA